MIKTRKRNKKKSRGGTINSDHINIYIKEVNPIIKFTFDNEDRIGNAEMKYNKEKTHLRIEQIWIESKYKGKGLGKFILKYLLDYAFKFKNIEKVTLEDLTQSNQFNPNKIPNHMYLKSGFIYINPNSNYDKNEMELTRERYDTVTLINNYLYK